MITPCDSWGLNPLISPVNPHFLPVKSPMDLFSLVNSAFSKINSAFWVWFLACMPGLLERFQTLRSQRQRLHLPLRVPRLPELGPGGPGKWYDSFEQWLLKPRWWNPFGDYTTLHILAGWWLGTFFIFPYIGNVIIPTDYIIFFRGVNHQPVGGYKNPIGMTQSGFWTLLSWGGFRGSSEVHGWDTNRSPREPNTRQQNLQMTQLTVINGNIKWDELSPITKLIYICTIM